MAETTACSQNSEPSFLRLQNSPRQVPPAVTVRQSSRCVSGGVCPEFRTRGFLPRTSSKE